jgi:putative resolvase
LWSIVTGWPGFGVKHFEAALGAQGRWIVVADLGETTDDLVRDMLTGVRARQYGRCGACNGVMRALTAAKREPGGAA